MPKPRFKVMHMEHRVRHAGVITIDDIRKQFKIPEHADVYVQVPGGADWSNCKLHIGDDVEGVHVSWEEVK